MNRLRVLACVLLMAAVCDAATVKSNGTGGGRWSAPGTWAGKVPPANNDSVTIVTGDTITFDVDMSGWVNGLAGLTCNGTMNCSTAAGTYCLKTGADISGTGTINCGSFTTAYPTNCTMVFDFDSKPNSFECGSGLTLNLYCSQPVHPVIALAAAATAGQMALPVDTDVRGDLWTPGQTIRIDAISGSVPDSEPRVIASGGITAAAVTVTAGLTSAKAPEARVVLVTRNVRIIGSADYAVKSMTGGVLGCEISNCARAVSSSSGTTIFGSISGSSHGIFSSSGGTVSTSISGCGYGVASHAGGTISGSISGCNYGVASHCGGTISGPIAGCACAVIDGSGCLISSAISGCTSGIYYSSGCVISGVISGCTNGIYAGSNTIRAVTFSGNTHDLRRVVSGSAHNTIFGSATENYEYDTDKVPLWNYVASYNHDGVPGDFKAWTRGGVVVSDANTVPVGYKTSYRHTCTSSAIPCFRQELTTIGPGQSVWAQGKILILDDHTTWAPRLEIVEAQADPLIDVTKAPLASAQIPAPRGRYYWQDVSVGYTNTSGMSKQVWTRCSAQRVGCDVYEAWSTTLSP